MKSFKQSKSLLYVILILMAASCQKGIDFIKGGYNQPNAACLVNVRYVIIILFPKLNIANLIADTSNHSAFIIFKYKQ